jgi:hypothetical protein
VTPPAYVPVTWSKKSRDQTRRSVKHCAEKVPSKDKAPIEQISISQDRRLEIQSTMKDKTKPSRIARNQVISPGPDSLSTEENRDAERRRNKYHRDPEPKSQTSFATRREYLEKGSNPHRRKHQIQYLGGGLVRGISQYLDDALAVLLPSNLVHVLGQAPDFWNTSLEHHDHYYDEKRNLVKKAELVIDVLEYKLEKLTQIKNKFRSLLIRLIFLACAILN